jgi:predicted dehydrogenase
MVIAAKKAVDAGAIGKPYMMRVRFAHGGPFPGWAVSDWFYDPERAGGGAVLDMGIHAMDLMLWFLGKATEVKGFAGTLRKDIAVDDNMTALLKFGNDAMGYMECGWTSCAGFSGQEIMGDKGAITIDYSKGEVIQCSGVTSPDGSVKMENQVIAKRGGLSAWQNQMAVFIEEKLADKEFSTSIQDGIEALKIGLGVYESSLKGNTVKL